MCIATMVGDESVLTSAPAATVFALLSMSSAQELGSNVIKRIEYRHPEEGETMLAVSTFARRTNG